MTDREVCRLTIIGIIAESHGLDLTKPFDYNAMKLSAETADKVMAQVDKMIGGYKPNGLTGDYKAKWRKYGD